MRKFLLGVLAIGLLVGVSSCKRGKRKSICKSCKKDSAAKFIPEEVKPVKRIAKKRKKHTTRDDDYITLRDEEERIDNIFGAKF
ncbi:hypothetical protein HN446_02675 [bacterium]|jgi:hypothetical protein|nr:hypothetical protein [bacterium]